LAELLELSGVSRRLAEEEAFLVAERGGEFLAALTFRVGVRHLSLGVIVPTRGNPSALLRRCCTPRRTTSPASWVSRRVLPYLQSREITLAVSDTVSGMAVGT